eukprot:TRINITY_DN2568_c0_g1_i1.p1 TRINITY_DN2568_c0_g1~~TRINITY_DN2568_c0_g1_i1.p1  ORF type:complete len:1027 (-),score=137.97 TRINITY_DN2568_c0_g1_i1:83-3163(-)
MESGCCMESTPGDHAFLDEEWTIIPDVNETKRDLITSICMDKTQSQRNATTKEFVVFENVVLLPSVLDDELGHPTGTLVMTKYDLVFADQKETKRNTKQHLLPHVSDFSKVPFNTIGKIEINKQHVSMVEILCKDLRYLVLKFDTSFTALNFYETLGQHPCYKDQSVFAMLNDEKFPGTTDGWTIFDWNKEFFVRQQVPTHKWRLTAINNLYEVCRTYPRAFVVPAKVRDNVIKKAAKFRTSGRMPALCWYNRANKASLTRCSQPMVGLMQMRSEHDEQLITAIISTNPNRRRMLIVDCRPWVNAIANRAKGAGTESIDHYPNCALSFLNIDNIHTMRASFAHIAETVRKRTDVSWFSSEEWMQTLTAHKGWLHHLSLLLSGAKEIMRSINKGHSVLVHCSDGWDRTSQLCALSQLLLDPYYRTIEGFEVLIEKEWLAYGHKFASRSGHFHQHFFSHHEASPIFLQFVDCVHQLILQHESAFEFNQQFLITLMDHVYSCKYGTFVYDTEKLRAQNGLRNKTLSVWTYMNHYKQYFTNPVYQRHDGLIRNVNTDVTSLSFWAGYYLRYHRRDIVSSRASNLTNHVQENYEGIPGLTRAKAQLPKKSENITKTGQSDVKCTFYRTEGKVEKPFLVAHITGPSKELVDHFCQDIQNLKNSVIEDYPVAPCSPAQASIMSHHAMECPITTTPTQHHAGTRLAISTPNYGTTALVDAEEDNEWTSLCSLSDDDAIYNIDKPYAEARKKKNSTNIAITNSKGNSTHKKCSRSSSRVHRTKSTPQQPDQPSASSSSSSRARCLRRRHRRRVGSVIIEDYLGDEAQAEDETSSGDDGEEPANGEDSSSPLPEHRPACKRSRKQPLDNYYYDDDDYYNSSSSGHHQHPPPPLEDYIVSGDDDSESGEGESAGSSSSAGRAGSGTGTGSSEVTVRGIDDGYHAASAVPLTEVVRVAVSSQFGATWEVPVRWSDYLSTMSRYLSEYNLMPVWGWNPQASGDDEIHNTDSNTDNHPSNDTNNNTDNDIDTDTDTRTLD